jgi:hypothetical protein
VARAGRLPRDDVLYVAPALYHRLSEAEQGWLWQTALAARVRLITDLEVDPPIVVHRPGEGGPLVARRWGDH